MVARSPSDAPHVKKHVFHLCINNAIIGVQEQNTYAQMKGTSDLLEDRRKRALALLGSGYSLNEVGGVSVAMKVL